MLNPNRPMIAIGTRRAYDYYVRRVHSGHRPLDHARSLEQLRGRTFIMDDLIFLHDSPALRDYADIYRYALYIDSIYNSRDSDESGAVRGGSEATPHTD